MIFPDSVDTGNMISLCANFGAVHDRYLAWYDSVCLYLDENHKVSNKRMPTVCHDRDLRRTLNQEGSSLPSIIMMRS